MTTTKSILNLMETTTTVEVPFLVRASFDEISSTITDDGKIREKVFQYIAGDEDNPMNLRCIVRQDPKDFGGKGSVTSTYKISTYASEVDDSTSEVLWLHPVTAALTVSVPGMSAVVDPSDFLALLGNLYTAFFAAVDGSNIPTTTVADKLKYNVPAIQ